MNEKAASESAASNTEKSSIEHNSERISPAPNTFDTLEVLKQFGFEPDASVLSDDGQGVSYDFGNLKLSAGHLLNRHFVEIIQISGIHTSQRSISSIEIELPLRVTSVEQCAAFIAWGLDKQTGRKFIPLKTTRWLDEGRNNFDTLPWVRKQKLYGERPKCEVDRDWLRLALRDLRSHLPELSDNDIFVITFQGEILSIRSRLKLIALPAAGDNWQQQYEFTASKFQHLPKRLNQKVIEISVWDDYLLIANVRYSIDKTAALNDFAKINKL